MGEDILGEFVFWQERRYTLRNWQEETSTIETLGNSCSTAAGRPALITLALAAADLEVSGGPFFRIYIFRSCCKRYTRCDWVEFPR